MPPFENESKFSEPKSSFLANSRKTILTQKNITLWTPEEVAQVLDVTVGTLQVWRTTKRYPLPYVKIGRNVRYRPEDVQAFIESRTIAV
ncbi:MAG: helix-turn-helix domain-containing protein [Porticoccaceae bacterium]